MAGSANSRGSRPFLQHFPQEDWPRVAEDVVRCITIGPPVAEMPRDLLRRVRRFAAEDIRRQVELHPGEACDACEWWLDWWQSQAPSAGGRR